MWQQRQPRGEAEQRLAAIIAGTVALTDLSRNASAMVRCYNVAHCREAATADHQSCKGRPTESDLPFSGVSGKIRLYLGSASQNICARCPATWWEARALSDVPVLNIATLGETRAPSGQVTGVVFVERTSADEPDYWRCWLLRTCRERPRCCRTEAYDEVPPSHCEPQAYERMIAHVGEPRNGVVRTGAALDSNIPDLLIAARGRYCSAADNHGAQAFWD
jgi:hypothetical protein